MGGGLAKPGSYIGIITPLITGSGPPCRVTPKHGNLGQIWVDELSEKRAPGCLGYMGDYIIQLLYPKNHVWYGIFTYIWL